MNEHHKRQSINAFYRRRTRELRLETIAAYGGSCRCCGESYPWFLVVDHIHGGGNKQRKEVKATGSAAFYAWLKRNKYPSDFQLLCANCNMAKRDVGCFHPLIMEAV